MTLARQLIAPLLDDARATVADGFATRSDVDLAMRLGAGHPQGPFEIMGESAAPSPSGAGGPIESLARAAVVGTGTMATGIAEVLARSGTETFVVSRSAERAASAVQRIDSRLGRAVQRGKLSADHRAEITGRLHPASDLSAAADADLVIEAVVEQVEVKRDLLAALETAAPGVPLATNTSSFRISELNGLVTDRERVFALHFFNPAPAMRLVEVVGGTDTDPELVVRGHAWARSLGKVSVSCHDEPGFLVNRLLVPYLNDAALRCSTQGVDWSEADAAVRDELGHPMGPFELMDLIGLDVMVFALETMQRGFGDDRYSPTAPLRELVKAGHLGRKTGQGFYQYGDAR